MVSKHTYSDEDRVSLTDAGLWVLRAANLKMVLADLESEMQAILQEAQAQHSQYVSIQRLGEVWGILRCGEILTAWEEGVEEEGDEPVDGYRLRDVMPDAE